MRTLPLMLVLALPTFASAETFSLKDGDRVVFLGNTLIEREQLSGWWELALTTRFPDKKVTFRNLGWSGDNVFGTARAGFGDAREGFRQLKEQTLALKPTVLIIGYGNVEAFEGDSGKEKFRSGLETLLDALAPSKARVVLLSPVAHATRHPLPNPESQNRNVRLYANLIRDVAAARKCRYVDLQVLLVNPPRDGAGSRIPVTLNGIHLTDSGYRETAGQFVDLLCGTRDTARPPADEKLRKLIVAKNELFFHRWRPQNVTYLTGFRKSEQGRNAREIAQFDPLVEAKEQEIARLAAKK